MKPHDIVLVLQGGGALGSYQAGVFEALAGEGVAPTAVGGISIGAINTALIAGNAPGERVARLREFWERVSAAFPEPVWTPGAQVHGWLNRLAANQALFFGVPGFFTPRMLPAPLQPRGTPAALGYYVGYQIARRYYEATVPDTLDLAERGRGRDVHEGADVVEPPGGLLGPGAGGPGVGGGAVRDGDRRDVRVDRDRQHVDGPAAGTSARP